MSGRTIGFSLLGLILCTGQSKQTVEDADRIEFEGFSPKAEAIVIRWAETTARIKSYRDDASVDLIYGPGDKRHHQQTRAFAYEHPRRFRFKTTMHEIACDGRQLTVFAKNTRRYLSEPLEADVLAQIKKYDLGPTVMLSLPEAVLCDAPGRYFAERFKDFDLVGEEAIGTDECFVLEGLHSGGGAWAKEQGGQPRPAKIYFRKKDLAIRRAEFDMATNNEDASTEDRATVAAFGIRRIVLDIADAKINEGVDREKLEFTPPTGAKKVDKFYVSWTPKKEAEQFELSGRPAPEFELETADGELVSLASHKGQVVILHFMAPRSAWRASDGDRTEGIPSFARLEELRQEFRDKDMAILCIYPEADAAEVLKDMTGAGQKLPIVLDPNRDVFADYFENEWHVGTVLVDKDGVVQGVYRGYLTSEQFPSLRESVDKLLSGEALPSGRPMSAEELSELRSQQSPIPYPENLDDPINEEHLEETWAVRAPGDRGLSFGVGSASLRQNDVWVRTKNVFRRFNAQGEVVAELPIANPQTDEQSQEDFLIAQYGGRPVLIHLSTTPGDAANEWGWKAPQSVTIAAGDESGEMLWKIVLDIKGQQLPQHLALGDVDGRRGDELVFLHRGSVWIVSDRGETIVRKPIPGWVVWLRATDLDHDRRAEIYVRTGERLYRYDYKGRERN